LTVAVFDVRRAHFSRIQPEGVKSINIELEFEEALKLSTAIQAAVLQLNRYNRTDKDGRDMGLCLSLKVPSTAISVIEQRIRPAKEPGQRRAQGVSADGTP